MLSLIMKVAAATAAVGFSAGILAHRKASQAKEVVKEKLSRTKTEIVHVKIPKGVSIEDCKIQIYCPIADDE